MSGSDFFALLDQNGKLVVAYNHGDALNRADITEGLAIGLSKPEEPVLLALDNLLYEISIQPLFFGSKDGGTHLGYVAVGTAIDDHVARAVSEAAAAEVAFAVDGKVIVSTLEAGAAAAADCTGRRSAAVADAEYKDSAGEGWTILRRHSVSPRSECGRSATHAPQLVVLKSFEEATRLTDKVNRWVVTLALLALVAGAGMLLSISRTLTRRLRHWLVARERWRRGTLTMS